MKRKIDYSSQYKTLDFEKTQVKYRQKQVLKILNQYPHQRILEVGCGLSSIAKYLKSFHQMVIVEASPTFSALAKKHLKGTRT